MKQKVQKPTTNNREGAMLLFVAVLMVFIFVAVTIGVDVARMHLTRAELQAATDASARAGVEALGRTQNEQAGIDSRRQTVET